MSRPHPPAQRHGALREILPGLYLVTGTAALPGPLPVRFSRNMTVVRQGERLVLVNSVRLDETGLAALEALGKITDVVRLASNHGLDDPFYAERYGAKVWAVKGQRYTAGFDTSSPNTYYADFLEMDESTPLPIEGAKLHVIRSTPPEGNLVLDRDGGVLISGDSLQNWYPPDEYFSFLAKPIMKVLGFLEPHNIGPGWLKRGKPPAEDLRAILQLDFSHVLPAHGAPVIGDARDQYRAAIERVTA